MVAMLWQMLWMIELTKLTWCDNGMQSLTAKAYVTTLTVCMHQRVTLCDPCVVNMCDPVPTCMQGVSGTCTALK